MLRELMYNFRHWCECRDACDFLIGGVGARHCVGNVRFRHEGGAWVPDTVTARLLALAFRLLLATFAAIGTAATTTTTATAATFFTLLFGCGCAIDRCAVDSDGRINLRHVLRSRGLRRRITFRTVPALLVTALISSLIATTALLLTFVARFTAGFALWTLAARATTATSAAAFTAAA